MLSLVGDRVMLVALPFAVLEAGLQEHIPGDSLSRVSSFDYLSSTILMPIGTAIAGPVATSVGTHTTLVAMSAMGVACALGFLAVPSVRALPRGAGAQAEARAR